MIDTAASFDELSAQAGFSLRKPFILKAQQWVPQFFESGPFKAELKDFKEQWNAAPLKITEGRCQYYVTDVEVADVIRAALVNKLGDLKFEVDGSEEVVGNLRNALLPSMVAFVGGHIAAARFELHELGEMILHHDTLAHVVRFTQCCIHCNQ